MIIKKFIAKTEKEAIENARAELGEGVVVMNVKPVKPKGLFAFLKTPMWRSRWRLRRRARS